MAEWEVYVFFLPSPSMVILRNFIDMTQDKKSQFALHWRLSWWLLVILSSKKHHHFSLFKLLSTHYSI